MTLTTKCLQYSGNSQEKCVAAYGFTIQGDQHFQVGPGPQGQLLSGTLEPGEFKAIEDLVTALLPALARSEGSENCVPYTQGEANEQLLLSHQGRELTILHTAETTYCFQTPTLNEAESFQQTIRRLALKYYPLPFPDECLDTAQSLEALYPQLYACTSDHDCSFLDKNYVPIPLEQTQYITTDACTVMKPLVVANPILMAPIRGQLLETRRKALEICGARVIRLNCSETLGFYTNQARPVCLNNTCQVNPS